MTQQVDGFEDTVDVTLAHGDWTTFLLGFAMVFGAPLALVVLVILAMLRRRRQGS